MNKTYLLPLLALTHTATAATFVIGDGFALNGSGSFGVDPSDNPFSSPGVQERQNSITEAETSIRIDVATGLQVESPFSSDPLIAGQISFGNGLTGIVYQSQLSFDLSLLPTDQTVTMVELFLEVTGTNFNNGVRNTGDSVQVNFHAGATAGGVLPATNSSFSISNSDEDDLEGEFISILFDPSEIDLSSGVFNVVLDAGVDPITAGIFGSGLGLNGDDTAGTNSVSVSPALRITTVPEPSAFLLTALAGLGFMARRRR